MPTILIKEVDQTNAVGTMITDIAYVPGLLGQDAATGNEYINTPILCSSVREFESYFGKHPQMFSAGKSAKYKDTTMFTTTEKDRIDKSFVYAKELLNSGMPVLYEAIKQVASNAVKVKMGACTYVAPKAKTAATITPLDGGTKFKDNENNTLAVNTTDAYNNDLYIEIENDKSKYFVSIFIADANAVVKNIYYKTADGDLGATLENPGTSFITSDDVDKYTVHLVLNEQPAASTEKIAVNNLEYIKVMVSAESYKPFEYYVSTTGSDLPAVDYLYAVLPQRLENLTDKSLYDVKYVTAGGYPTFHEDNDDIAMKMMNVCFTRGDAVALPDHVIDNSRALIGPGSLYDVAIKNRTFGDGSYGAMFTNYGEYNCATITHSEIPADQVMPGSFGYLMCLARAIQTSPNWLAMAGVSRGVVPNINKLTCKQALSNVIADNYQPRFNGTAINAITEVKPYGLTVYGNRTLARVGEELKAQNFLNTRNMMSDIKKQAYKTAKNCMFEQDSDAMWIKFKAGMTPLLNNLKSGFGISNYKLIKSATNINGEPLGKGQVGVVIKVYPIYAVEYFEISVVIADDVQIS